MTAAETERLERRPHAEASHVTRQPLRGPSVDVRAGAMVSLRVVRLQDRGDTLLELVRRGIRLPERGDLLRADPRTERECHRSAADGEKVSPIHRRSRP